MTDVISFSPLAAEAETLELPDLKIGIALFDFAGAWHAVNTSTGIDCAGAGSIADLPRGLWLTDLGYREANGVGVRGQLVKRADWIKPGIDGIRRAWGLSGASTRAASRFIAPLATRTGRLLIEAFARDPDYLEDIEIICSRLRGAPSMTTGVGQVLQGRIDAALPADKLAQSHLSKAHLGGIYIPDWWTPADNTRTLDFSLPKLSHALAVTRAPVPSSATWAVGRPATGVSAESFLDTILEDARPYLVNAEVEVSPGQTPVHLETFINGPKSSHYRYYYTTDEIRALRAAGLKVDVRGVSAGGDWQPSDTGELLDHLVEAAGGREAAGISWSVNIVAENILGGAFRPVSREADCLPPEGVWIAARDRSLMLPVVSALSDAGAVLVSASCGAITVKVPDDPEILMSVVLAAWEQGAYLPSDTVAELKEIGVEAPWDMESWGGNPVDYLPAAASHRLRKNALWQLDGVQDLDLEKRRVMGKQLAAGQRERTEE